MEEFVLLSLVLFSSNYLCKCSVDKHILPFVFEWCYLCGYDKHQVRSASQRRNFSVIGILSMAFLGMGLAGSRGLIAVPALLVKQQRKGIFCFVRGTLRSS